MFQWVYNYLIGLDVEQNTRLFKLERKVEQMSVELDELREAVVLVNKAVDEAVAEIHDLAEQLRVCATKPHPDADDIEALADTLKATAERLHGAVYPPSSHVDLEA
jgi:chromosome segregation ATPase